MPQLLRCNYEPLIGLPVRSAASNVTGAAERMCPSERTRPACGSRSKP